MSNEDHKNLKSQEQKNQSTPNVLVESPSSDLKTLASTGNNSEGWLSLVFNILVPILILNNFSKNLGPTVSLILALLFPLVYGIYHFLKTKKPSFISILGFINISVTGTLALFAIGGIWFCIKEAFFPFIIGLFVLFSSYTKNPFIKTLFMNPQLLKLDLLEEKLKELNGELKFNKHLKKSTQLFSLSFFLSALINFFVSLEIFVPISESLDSNQKAILLNEQISKMTGLGNLFVFLPSLIITFFLLWYLLKGIENITQIDYKELLKS